MKPLASMFLVVSLILISPQLLKAQKFNCRTFSETPNPDQAESNYVLYRGFLKTGDWVQAYSFWKKVYEVAPAADGRRNTVFNDGIRIYEHFISETSDSLRKEAYTDTIFMIYNAFEACYPRGGYVPSRKGFDLFYKYPNRAKNRKEVYNYFIKSIDLDGLETNDFILRPLAKLLVELFDKNEISIAEAQKYNTFINNRITKGLEECKRMQCAQWEMVKEHVPKRLEYFERIKGFYPCEYYIGKYYSKFEAKPEDCDLTSGLYAYLKLAECDENDERFKNVHAVLIECEKPKPGTIICGDGTRPSYLDSLHKYKVAFALETDSLQKANLSYKIAFIYCYMVNNYNKARTWAEQSIEYNPNSGASYILIGDAYSKSRRYCGIGKGWASNATIWAAIDMWEKAKVIDASMTEKADKRINSYRELLPTKAEISSQQMSVGDTYFVECWINQVATIRSRD